MAALEDTFDSSLRRIHRAFLQRRAGRPGDADGLPVPADGRITVRLQYTGDLATIVPLGFTPVSEDAPGHAIGGIDLNDVERLVASDQVVALQFGEPRTPMLDLSIPDVRADEVWTLTAGTFTGTTGKEVLVAVIDSGIDWRHDFFLSSLAPKTTRILRIWDQGLIASGAEKTPLGAGLAGAPDYGVEYTDAHINAQLQGVGGALPVRHVDCVGHGTHVASIAAGDGRGPYTHVGVAPEADIIVVKHLDTQASPSGPLGPIGPDQLFIDSVNYVLQVADDLGKPVVINLSFGSSLGPHDGFTNVEDFLTTTFTPPPAGKICVAAAGNDGDKSQHATIVFTAAASIDIPLEIFDDRGARKLNYQRCVNVWGTRAAGFQVWYPTGGATLTGEVRFPGTAAFKAGPALGGPAENDTFLNRDYSLTNASQTQLLRSGAGSVVRNALEFVIQPHRNRHVLGTYTLRLTASGPLTAHLWCRRGSRDGMRLVAAGQPAEVTVEDRWLIGAEGGAANVVTVAAHNAEDRPAVPITPFSSRGPLVAHGAVPVAQPAKPDVAAPGMSVDAAKSRSSAPWGPSLLSAKRGTSMSAPHVAGAVALMLQKKPTLTVTEALTTLRDRARKVPPATADETGGGRLDVKNSFDNVPP
jgi:subtilisin family serine protease